MERVRVGKNLTDGAISRVFYLAFHSIAYDLVNPRLSEWASRSVRVKQSQCFRTSIFIPTVLFSLHRRRWKHMQNPQKMYGKHGLHLERYSKSSILGGVPPRNPTSYPFTYHFWRKRYPFRIPSIDNWYAFHIPSLEPVADPGEGPGPNRIFRPNWGPKGRKIFFGGGPPPPRI